MVSRRCDLLVCEQRLGTTTLPRFRVIVFRVCQDSKYSKIAKFWFAVVRKSPRFRVALKLKSRARPKVRRGVHKTVHQYPSPRLARDLLSRNVDRADAVESRLTWLILITNDKPNVIGLVTGSGLLFGNHYQWK